MQSSKHHNNKYKLQSPYVESDLQGKICRWLGDTPFDMVGESKVSSGGTINFNDFEDQQLPSLVAANSDKGLYHKPSDMLRLKKPFDFFCCVNRPAYVVAQFWKNRQQEICYLLDIKKVMEIKESGAKSLKEEDFMLWGRVINLAKYK